MPTEALVLTLLAAVMHASWNAIVKVGIDRAMVLALIALAHTVVGAVMIAMGVAMMTGTMSVFAFWLLEQFPILTRIG